MFDKQWKVTFALLVSQGNHRLSLPNQAWGDCLSPYKVFFNMHTLFLSPIDLKLGGISM